MSTTSSMLSTTQLLLPFKTISALALGLLALVLLQTEIDFSGLTSGFQHPFVGNDHLITMLAVGVWAARMRGHAVWSLPLAFVGVMSLGGLAGASGLYVPQVEGLVLLSCGVFGVLIARNIRFSSKINILIVAFFGFFHGFAHGQEISASAGLLSYIVGFVAATLILHGAGIALTKGAIIAFSLMLSALTASACTVSHDAVKPLANVTLIASASLSMAVRAALNSTRIARRRQPERQRPPAAPLRASPTIPIYHFNRMFPVINHSPGLGLSSNGVGRTSPPLPTILPALTSLFLVAAASRLRHSLRTRFLSGRFVSGHHPAFSVCSTRPFSLLSLPRDAYPNRYRFSFTTITRHLSQ